MPGHTIGWEDLPGSNKLRRAALLGVAAGSIVIPATASASVKPNPGHVIEAKQTKIQPKFLHMNPGHVIESRREAI